MKSPSAQLAEELTAEDAMQAARQSEFAYFRAASHSESGPNWFITQMPGLEHIPSASYGFWDPSGQDEDTAFGPDAALVVAAIEAAFERLGARHTRIYTDESGPDPAKILNGKGYRGRKEIAFLQNEVRTAQVETPLEMCAVASEADWADKLALHETSDHVSDGHRARARDWVSLERRKAETGAVTCYLFKQDGEVVATAGLMRPWAGTIRLKNLFVSARHRKKRMGHSMLEALSNRARQTYHCLPVIYAVEGTVGEKLYLSAGFKPIGAVYEWMREKP